MCCARILLLFCLFGIPCTRTVQAEVLINFQPAQSNGSSAFSVCQCSFNDDQALLHWSCEPFSHSVSSTTRSDVTLSAAVTGGVGNMVVAPLTATDQTHYSSGDEAAEIAMTMEGTGAVEVTVQVAIDANSAVAGSHHTTVFLTVTSN